MSIAPIMLEPDLMQGPASGATVRATRDFEASLIASLLESIEKSYGSVPGESNTAGFGDYGYLGTQALAGAMAAHGGFGIADLIKRDLALHEGKG